jgi:gliding motility-associated-like protein
VNLYFDSLEHVPNFLTDNGTFCYRIDAVYFLNLPSPSGYQDTLISSSNQVCIVHRPVIYVPNAFSPGLNNAPTANQTFKPTIIYGAPTGYTMLIFNRWGGKVFESNDLNVGWDGTDHGKEAEMAGYAYLIDFTAADGTLIERKGMVLLVR